MFVLGVSLGHPDVSPPEDGGNPRFATTAGLDAWSLGRWGHRLSGEEDMQV